MCINTFLMLPFADFFPQIHVPPPIILKRDHNFLKRQKLSPPIDNESDDQIIIKEESLPTYSPQQQKKLPVKILNRANVKILNINAPNHTVEPIMKKPIIRTGDDGYVEIATEILETAEESDAIRYAPPVETDVFPCDMCERSFPLRQLLDIHMANHIRERSFTCTICKKGFFSKYDLGKHKLIHTGEKPHKCVVCKKAFSRSTLLTRHEKIHTDQPKLLCVYCERQFLSKPELDKHTERHKKRRPFPCKMCGKSFAFKQGLERHEAVHAKEQPHKCEHCDMSFPTPSKLARHLTAHAGRRPYPCRLCPKSYLLSHHLTRHLRSHSRSEPGSYKCYECDKVFASRDELIFHSAVHATQSLTCPLCKLSFENIEEVTAHIKSHTEGEQFACEFCDLIFTSEKQLEMHREVQHSDEHAAYTKDNQTRIIKSEIGDTAAGAVSDDDGGGETDEYIVEEEQHEYDDDCVDPLAGNEDGGEVSFEKFCSGFDDEEHDRPLNQSELMLDDGSVDKPIRIRTDNLKVFKGNVVNVPKRTVQRPTSTAPSSKSVVTPILRKINITNTLSKLPKGLSVTRKVEDGSSTATKEKNNKMLLVQMPPSRHSPPKKSPVAVDDGRKISPSSINKATTAAPSPNSKLIEMKIGSETIRVQKVRMTKAEVEAMAKQGKIEYKGGQVFLKKMSER